MADSPTMPSLAALPGHVDASVSWLALEEDDPEPIQRLRAAVAEVLRMHYQDVHMLDSFVELGGTDDTARALQELCLVSGMAVEVMDILQCPSLADLATRMTSFANESASTRSESFSSALVPPLDMKTRNSLEVRSHSRHSRHSSTASATSGTPPTDFERALLSQKTVAAAVTTYPKAGLLEGKLVALVTLAGLVGNETYQPGVRLIAQSHMLFAGTQVSGLRRALAGLVPAEAMPDIWIVLDRMPLTESGQIDRRQLRTWTQNVNDDIYYRVLGMEREESLQAPTTEMERSLRSLVSRVLGVPPDHIGINFSFAQMGGDELGAMDLVARCKHESIYLTVTEVLASVPISELAQFAMARGGLAHKTAEEEIIYEPFELSPMQQLYFSSAMGQDDDLRADPSRAYRFNQSLLLRCKQHDSVEDISAAVEAIVGHHPMLRARFSRGPNGWTQRIVPETDSYTLNLHHIHSDDQLKSVIQDTQARIDIETGPVFAADYLTTHDGQNLLYLAAHHLVVDLPSWRLIIRDLDELLQNGSLLSQRSMPFSKWIEMQKAAVANVDPKSFLPFEVAPGDAAYWGLSKAPNTYGSAVEIGFTLSEELTSLLQTTCNQVFKTESADIYLAALMLSFAQTFPDRRVPTVWSQEHGRDAEAEMDIAETVGWFTTLSPIGLNIRGTDDFIQVLRALKDTRRWVTPRGRYFASQFLNGDPALACGDWPYEIIFSYAGSMQQLEKENGVLEQLGIPGRTLGSAASRRTSDIGPDVGRVSIFEFSVVVDHGQAKTKLWYNTYSKDPARIALWFQNFEHLLLEAIGRLRYRAKELTLADVPSLDVTYKGLERFHKERLPALNMDSVRDIEAVYPVTAVQQAILISQAQNPELCSLHAIFEFASFGGEPIDLARLCKAWEHVTSRHTALRTVFSESVTETGLFDQIVLRRASPDMLFIETAPFDDPVKELKELPGMRVTHPKPPHRLTVCKTPLKTLVKLDISAAVCDTTSLYVLVADLRRAYATEKPIPEAVQYKTAELLAFLREACKEEGLDFWKRRLDGIPPSMFPRLLLTAEEQKYSHVAVDLECGIQELAIFAKAHTTTVDGVLRLAWALVLRCFTGSRHVCFGYQVPGRDGDVAGLRNAVGSFANLVPCAYDLVSINTVPACLGMVQEEYEACLPHQYFTLSEIYHAMGLRGDSKLFNSCLTVTEEPAGLKSKFATRSSSELKAIDQQQSFDMDVAMNVRVLEGRLVADLGHRILSTDQALSVAHTFGRAIDAILQSYGGSIGALNLFSDKDCAQILAWTKETEPPTTWTKMMVHELVSNQASQSPTSQAIAAWDGTFTYEEMEEQASKLAHYLCDAGIGHHDIVPVVMEKSRWAPVAMLAVLKSGASFVPIDSEELALLQPIFDHLNSRCVIASGQSASIMGNLFDKVIVLSDDLMARLPREDHTLSAIFDEEDPACVLFTQTSSSQVRGISFSHAAMSTALLGQGPAAQISSTSRVMQLSSFNVDIALAEIFTTLVHGGCVCIPSGPERLQDFTGAVQRMEVNWTYMTPLLSRKLEPILMPSLKVVCFRTSSLDEDTYSPWAGRASVLLAYGPQDVCPLGISFLEVKRPQHLRCIAQPFCGSMGVVNSEDQRKLMPVGAVGELVIGGPTLGNEHANSSNDRRTLNLDFDGGKKSRYFKTGHRARYTEDGLLEFIGSKREELVIEGNVINFPHIEKHLRRCLGQGVDVMVEVLAFRGMQKLSRPILAAFVELGENLFDGEENLTELSDTTKERVYIARQLVETGMKNVVPPQMIPSIFIPVKHLPITPSLKVDRNRLQTMIRGLSKEKLRELAVVPNPNNISSLGLKPLPLTDNENRLRAIWAKTLGLDENSIGASDTFFRIGGDNIKAVALVAACRREGITMSISDVFRNATLTELCRSMVTSEETPSAPEPAILTESPQVVKPPTEQDEFIKKVIAPKLGLNPSSVEDMAEASATQIRFIESGMLRGRANIDYFVFNFTGPINDKKLEDACRTLVKIHPILRTAFLPHNRRVYQVVVADMIEFKRSQCHGWRLPKEVEKTIRKDSTSPIAFSTPITKFAFLDAGKQSALIMRLSKAQYDGISLALLVKDFKKLYDGVESPPPRPTFCEYSRCAQAAMLPYAEDYWRMLLNEASMTKVVAHTKPYQVSTRIQTVNHTMPVTSLANMGISFETVVKTAWSMVLASLSATADVVFGELVEGRQVQMPDHQFAAAVLGPAINTIPVRVVFPESAISPMDLLLYVQQQRQSSIPVENLGFLHLVERCTLWPYWTRFSTVVQHAHVDTMIDPATPKTFQLGSTSCKLSVNESKARNMCDILVQSLIQADGSADFTLTFDADRVPESFVAQALKLLCENIHTLTGVNIMRPLIPLASQYCSMLKAMPLPQAQSIPDLAGEAQGSIAELATALPEDQTREIQRAISSAWASVLNPRALAVPEDQLHTAAFYDLWGSLIPAVQLAGHLNRELQKLKVPVAEGSHFTMEDVIDHPTMVKQFELVLRKMKALERKDNPKEKIKEKSSTEALVNLPLRKRPSGTVVAASTSALKGIRRLASTVTRSTGTRTIASNSNIAETMVTAPLGSPAAPAELLSPDVPKVPAPVSSLPPQLPQLPFASFGEEADPLDPSHSESSRENAGSAETTTPRSSNSSHETADEADTLGHPGSKVLYIQPPAPHTGPLFRSEEEDLVSPLSAASPTSRPLDGYRDASLAVPSIASPVRPGKRRAGVATLSPVVEVATMESGGS